MSEMNHQSFGSQQLRLFRRAIRAGDTLEEAALAGDYSLRTAELIVADDIKNPPPPEAFELLYDPDAKVAASSTKEAAVAKEDEAGEYKRPDAEKAFRIYDDQIAPKLEHMATIKGDLAEPWGYIKEASFPKKVMNFIIALEDMEDAKRDHYLIALNEGFRVREITMPRDLVSMAGGRTSIIPTADRADDDLLVDEDEDEGELPLAAAAAGTFTEATDEEVAKQEGRKPRRTARPKEDTPAPTRGRSASISSIDVIDQAKKSLTDILSGRSTDFFGDLKQSLKDLQGKRLFDSLFGDVFQQLEDELRGQSPLGKESQRFADELSVATNTLGDFTAALGGARVAAANDNGIGSLGGGSSEFERAFGSIISGSTVGWHGGANPPGVMSASGEGGEIVVTPKKPTDIASRSIADIADKIAGAVISPFEKALGDAFGTEFAQMLGGVMKGALAGYMTGGTTGGILGGLKGVVDQTGIFGGASGGVSGALGKAGSGAATGTMTAGIMNSLGLKTSTTGAQIGGAIGSFVPIPGGEIIGSVVGGLIGGLFKTNRTANAILTSGDGYSQSGKDSGNYATAAGLGDSVLEGLNNIVSQLGGTIGNFMVTIGTRGDEYRVNPNGTSLKIKNGAISFGDDAEAAIAYAIKNAIEDGAIKGMRQSTMNIIKAGKDLDQALEDAVDWEAAFKELKKYKDPIGAALDDLDEEFEKLIEIGKAGSASAEEMAQLEELYGIKRNEIIKEQAETLIGSLKSLLSDLTTGDNGLSLRDRRAAALTEYDDLAARVAAGDTTAYDDYADAAQTLLGIERDLYGSQQEYFDRLNEVIDLTKTRIDAETNVVSINENRDSPFDSTGAVKSSIDTVNDTLTAQLTAVNQNIGTLISLWAQGITTGSSTTAARLAFASSF